MFQITLLGIALACGTWLIYSAIYNLYFHPLSRFPGPPSWAISRVPYVLTLIKGDLVQRTKELHDLYGDIVRLAPNELSFTDAQAWQDIYGHHQGRPNFTKNPVWMATGYKGPPSILIANDADHSRYRRLLSHAFSEKALRQQEYLLLSYVDLMISQLLEKAKPSSTIVVDIVQWFNFTTFDIIGDLSWGESFHCLENAQYHDWVSILFAQFKAATFLISLRFFRLNHVLKLLIPKSLLEKQKAHVKMTNEKINHRLSPSYTDTQRNDFMTYVLRYNDEKGMSVPEIQATFRTLVVAGSETTATALSGMTNYLIRSPEILKKLTTEIRQAFSHPTDICAERVSKLPYLNAVIEEGLRLYPPVPFGMPRLVPSGGSDVCGHWLPAGTFVSASGYASNRSPKNFPNQPNAFDPSRWLDASSNPQRSAFNPFLLGPHNCIGRNLAYLEMRLILSNLLWHFDIEGIEGPPRMWEDQKNWILWEKKPLYVRLGKARAVLSTST